MAGNETVAGAGSSPESGNQGGSDAAGGSHQGGGSNQSGQRRGNRPLNLPPFIVELGDDSNRTISLDTMRLRLRGDFSLSKLHKRKQGGRDVGQIMQQMPDIPGMRIMVDYHAQKCRIFDPLETPEYKDVLVRVNQVAQEATAVKQSGGKFTPVEAVEHKLDKDKMKTLCLELVRLVEDKQARVVAGELPTEEQLAAMPGRKLFDPWNNSPRKPKYEDDAEAFYARADKELQV